MIEKGNNVERKRKKEEPKVVARAKRLEVLLR